MPEFFGPRPRRKSDAATPPFNDIAFPALKIAIEFDGRVKYGNTVEEVHDSVEAQQRRQRRLELEGCRLRPLPTYAMDE